MARPHFPHPNDTRVTARHASLRKATGEHADSGGLGLPGNIQLEIVGRKATRDGSPKVTAEQRTAALAKAAAARRARMELKDRLKRGTTTLTQVFTDADTDAITDGVIGKTRVSDVLAALPKVGRVKSPRHHDRRRDRSHSAAARPHRPPAPGLTRTVRRHRMSA